jgi:hypothetical protein
LALTWSQGCATSDTNAPVVPSPSAAEAAERMICTSCGGRFAWVGRSHLRDVFECQDCGDQVPPEPMTSVRDMPRIPLRGTMTEADAMELSKKALQLRPDMSAEQIEATMGLARFATCSGIATNASGRVEMRYATEPDVLIVLSGRHRHLAPLIYVDIDSWRARCETNRWRVVEKGVNPEWHLVKPHIFALFAANDADRQSLRYRALYQSPAKSRVPVGSAARTVCARRCNAGIRACVQVVIAQ